LDTWRAKTPPRKETLMGFLLIVCPKCKKKVASRVDGTPFWHGGCDAGGTPPPKDDGK
jgi:hypothetical protein